MTPDRRELLRIAHALMLITREDTLDARRVGDLMTQLARLYGRLKEAR